MQVSPIGIIWDVSGVIVDAEPRHRWKLTKIARENGADITPDDWTEYHGKGDHYIGQRLREKFQNFSLNEADFIAACNALYISPLGELKARPGATQTIKALAARGIPQMVLTNDNASVLNYNLAAADLRPDHFTHVLDSHSLGDIPRKPHRDAFAHAADKMLQLPQLKHLNGDRGRIIMVEDSPANIVGAHNAGLRTIQWLLDESMGIPLDPLADWSLQPDESPYRLISSLTRRTRTGPVLAQ